MSLTALVVRKDGDGVTRSIEELDDDSLPAGEVTDPPGELHIAGGDAARVVADQRDVDVRIGERDVGVVLRLLRGGADGGDQREPLAEISGLKVGVQPLCQVAPVGQARVDDVLVRAGVHA